MEFWQAGHKSHFSLFWKNHVSSFNIPETCKCLRSIYPYSLEWCNEMLRNLVWDFLPSLEEVSELHTSSPTRAFLVAQMVKNLPETQETRIQSLGGEHPLDKYSSILDWRIPRTEEPLGLQSTGSQRVRYYWVTDLLLF